MFPELAVIFRGWVVLLICVHLLYCELSCAKWPLNQVPPLSLEMVQWFVWLRFLNTSTSENLIAWYDFFCVITMRWYVLSRVVVCVWLHFSWIQITPNVSANLGVMILFLSVVKVAELSILLVLLGVAHENLRIYFTSSSSTR